MFRLSVDLEPLFRLYNADGAEIHKPLLKNALALESAGADGVVLGNYGAYDPVRLRVFRGLAENLDMNLSIRTSIEEQWIEALLEIKPSLTIFAFDGKQADKIGIIVTRLQVANILVAFEIEPDLELVKQAARLKGDFLVFNCAKYLEAENVGGQIEQLNSISKAAALGSRLSLGSIAAGDFDKPRLARLIQTGGIEEVFIGMPVLSESLLKGYRDSMNSLILRI